MRKLSCSHRSHLIQAKQVPGTTGTGITEYIIIVFLIAVGTIGVNSLLADNLRALFATTDNSLAGVDSIPETQEAGCIRWSLKGGHLLATGSCPAGPGNFDLEDADPHDPVLSSDPSALTTSGKQNGLQNLAKHMTSGKFWKDSAKAFGQAGVDMVKDTAEMGWDIAKGTYSAVTHPVQSGQAIAEVISNPGKTAELLKELGAGIWEGGKQGLENWYTALTSDDPEEAAQAFGKAGFEVAGLAVAATKAKWLGKVGRQTDWGVDFLGRGLKLPSRVTDLGALKGKDVLDVGGGGGRFVREMNEAGAHAYAVDHNDLAFRNAGIRNNDHFIQGKAEQLPLRSGEFDVVYSNWSVFYYEKNPEVLTSVLSEMARVLKPGGEARLIGVDPATLAVLDRVPELVAELVAPLDKGSIPTIILRRQ